MRKKKKIFIITGIVIFVLVVALVGRSKRKSVPQVETIVAKKGNIISKVTADGTLKALNQVDIGSDVMGKIIKMKVKEGDVIHKGDVLCIIDQSIYKSRLKRAKSSLKLSKLRLSKAKTELERSTTLFENKLISKEKYEDAKLNYDVAAAELESNLESYNEAEENFKKTIITAPVDGEVVQVNKEEGEMVVMGTKNVPGSVMMTIADRSKMFVNALVDETEIVKIKLEQPVTITIDAFPDTTFGGKVTKIGGMPEKSASGIEQAINFPIEVELSEVMQEFYPGMSASCEITTNRKDSVIIIPYPALGRQKIKGEESDIVLLLKGNKVQIIPVKTGLTGDKGVEIKDGVVPGDTVLTGPYMTLRKLKDGDKVKVMTKPEIKKGKHPRRKPKVRIKP